MLGKMAHAVCPARMKEPEAGESNNDRTMRFNQYDNVVPTPTRSDKGGEGELTTIVPPRRPSMIFRTGDSGETAHSLNSMDPFFVASPIWKKHVGLGQAAFSFLLSFDNNYQFSFEPFRVFVDPDLV